MGNKKKQENFLDYIPKQNCLYKWQENSGKHVEISVPNQGIFNRTAQLLFHKPKVSRIELDDFGTFVWKQMDGQKSVYEIGKMIKEKFGTEAEPVFERLAQFIKILHKNGFVVYINKQKKKH